MEIRHVREFLALAETKSYTEASGRMGITSSALSRHIKALEDEIGRPLFILKSHKAALTGTGEAFLPFAHELLRVDDACSAAFAEVNREPEPVVRLGTIPLMKAYHITDIIDSFRSANKSVRLEIQEAYSSSLVPGLRNGELDFAVLRDFDDPDGEFDRILLARDRLCALIPYTHALADQDTIHISGLRGEPLLLIGKNAFLYRLCTDLCLQAGFAPDVRFCSHHADSLIDMVRKGTGVGLLMRKPAAIQIAPDLRLIDIFPAVETEIWLARSPYHRLSASARAFWKLAEQFAEM